MITTPPIRTPTTPAGAALPVPPLAVPHVAAFSRSVIIPSPITLGETVAKLELDRWAPFSGWQPSTKFELPSPSCAEASSGTHIGEGVQGAISFRGLPTTARDPSIKMDGVRNDEAVRGLIDLPCDAITSTVRVNIVAGSGVITTSPGHAVKTRNAIRLALTTLGVDQQVDVEVAIEAAIRPGRGMGSSSADVRAALKAVAIACQFELPVKILDFLTVCSENATNPASRHPSLFLHRLGVTVEAAPAWPRIRIIGFDDPDAPDVHTDRYRPAFYSDAEIDRFGLLFRAAMASCREGDAIGLARFCMESATINDDFLPRRGGGSLRSLHQIRRACDAAGFAISHSGTVGALLFSRDTVELDRRAARARAMLVERGCQVLADYNLG